MIHLTARMCSTSINIWKAKYKINNHYFKVYSYLITFPNFCVIQIKRIHMILILLLTIHRDVRQSPIVYIFTSNFKISFLPCKLPHSLQATLRHKQQHMYQTKHIYANISKQPFCFVICSNLSAHIKH